MEIISIFIIWLDTASLNFDDAVDISILIKFTLMLHNNVINISLRWSVVDLSNGLVFRMWQVISQFIDDYSRTLE